MDTTSDRLNGTLAEYDGAGNLIDLDFGAARYEYECDAVNMTIIVNIPPNLITS